MITAIAIENFKGIGDRVEIPIKPLTFLFGPNSAGKSTIIHALHYAREVFDRRNLDADTTVCGGRFIDLGGYAGVVHKREIERPIRLSVALDLSRLELPEYAPKLPEYAHDKPPQELFKKPKTATVHVETRWSHAKQRPYIGAYTVDFDGSPICSLQSPDSGGCIAEIRTHHPCLLMTPECDELSRSLESLLATAFESVTGGTFVERARAIYVKLNEQRKGRGDCLIDFENDPKLAARDLVADLANFCRTQPALNSVLSVARLWALFPTTATCEPPAFPIPTLSDAMPIWDSELPLPLDWTNAREESPDWISTDNNLYDEDDDTSEGLADVYRFQHWIFETLSRIVVGPGQLVRDCLRQFRYLGPLRETPPREYSAPRLHDETRWASGLGAWDVLQTERDSIVASVSEWLGARNRLDAGYHLRVKRYKECNVDALPVRTVAESADEGKVRELLRALENAPVHSKLVIVPTDSEIELRPHDLGVGISQIVPVIVTALAAEAKLSAIEQPELHIHPRLQAELGDLFIEGHASTGQSFVIETHSEHLILRILRRIRETSKGTPHNGRPITGDDVAVYYVNQDDGQTVVRRIDIDKNGEFVQPWPDDFFEIDFYERFS